MHFVVELERVGQLQLVLHVDVMAHAHEVVVPGALQRRHEEAEEAVTQQHLHLLVVRRQVAFRVVSRVFVLATPVEATRRQLVSSERTRARSEAAKT